MQDLTGGNVLLTSSPTNAHGFCTKIADFGAAPSPLLHLCTSLFELCSVAIGMHTVLVVVVEGNEQRSVREPEGCRASMWPQRHMPV